MKITFLDEKIKKKYYLCMNKYKLCLRTTLNRYAKRYEKITFITDDVNHSMLCLRTRCRLPH